MASCRIAQVNHTPNGAMNILLPGLPTPMTTVATRETISSRTTIAMIAIYHSDGVRADRKVAARDALDTARIHLASITFE
jgi:hypothetical protein